MKVAPETGPSICQGKQQQRGDGLPGEVPGRWRRARCAPPPPPRLRVLAPAGTERLSGANAQISSHPGRLRAATGGPYWSAPTNRHFLLCQLIR